MKCPKCDFEMEKGMLGEHGNSWLAGNSIRAKISTSLIFHRPRVFAYRCPNCKKVELQT